MQDLEYRFIDAGIPYDDLDKEMIPILEILNFKLNLRTKYCCYGHREGEDTYIMFADDVKDKDVLRILTATDEHVGTAQIRGVTLNKWARIQYQKYYKKPWWTQLNWMLHIKYRGEELREERLAKIALALANLEKEEAEES